MKKVKMKIKDLFLLYDFDDFDFEKEISKKIFGVRIKNSENKFQSINELVMKKCDDVVKITFSNGIDLICSLRHKLYCEDKNCYKINDIKNRNILLSNNSKIKIEKIEKIENQILYDFCMDSPHLYQTTNKLIHHNSFILFNIINLLKFMNENYKFLLIVPSISLVEQMKGDFIEYGENFCDYNDHIHTISSGKKKETEKSITISTWQSLQNIKDKSFFIQFDCVIADEAHGATATQLVKIMESATSAVFKIGTTGSLKNCQTSSIQLKSLFSRVFIASKTKQLQKAKILAKLKIRNCILDYKEEFKKYCSKLKYADEVDFIRSIEARKKFISRLVNKLKGNTLVLFKSIEYGNDLFDEIKIKNPDTYFVYGGTKVEDRENVRKIAEENDNVVIVASYQIFSQGINIKRLHNLVFGESVKSLIKVVQSIGRTLRIHPTKDYAYLYDICDNLSYGKRKNYVLKHFFERVRIYDDEGWSYKTRTFKFG